MKRRNFLIGVSGSAVGGSALIGSGAFDRIESDRGVTIAVAEDPDAYLGLDACDSPLGETYVGIDDSGHLSVDLSDNGNGGQGVNAGSRAWFDDLVRICNQGTEAACVWIEDAEAWPYVDGERRVDFYLGDDRETTIVGEENAVPLEVGVCTCIGAVVRTRDLSDGDAVLEDLDGRVTVHADVDGDCFETAPECVECGADGDADRLSRLEVENAGAEKTIEVRQHRPEPSETPETVFGPETVGAGETFGFDVFTTGPSDLEFYVDEERIAIDHADDNDG